jgi:hypothetical protein
MTTHCGLVTPNNPCRCKLKINCAVERGHVRPKELSFAHSLTQAKRFPIVLRTIRQLEDSRRVAALYRSHPEFESTVPFVAWLIKLLGEMPDLSLSILVPRK